MNPRLKWSVTDSDGPSGFTRRSGSFSVVASGSSYCACAPNCTANSAWFVFSYDHLAPENSSKPACRRDEASARGAVAESRLSCPANFDSCLPFQCNSQLVS